MNGFELGFLRKCAEMGVDGRGLLKIAIGSGRGVIPLGSSPSARPLVPRTTSRWSSPGEDLYTVNRGRQQAAHAGGPSLSMPRSKSTLAMPVPGKRETKPVSPSPPPGAYPNREDAIGTSYSYTRPSRTAHPDAWRGTYGRRYAGTPSANATAYSTYSTYPAYGRPGKAFDELPDGWWNELTT